MSTAAKAALSAQEPGRWAADDFRLVVAFPNVVPPIPAVSFQLAPVPHGTS